MTREREKKLCQLTASESTFQTTMSPASFAYASQGRTGWNARALTLEPGEGRKAAGESSAAIDGKKSMGSSFRKFLVFFYASFASLPCSFLSL